MWKLWKLTSQNNNSKQIKTFKKMTNQQTKKLCWLCFQVESQSSCMVFIIFLLVFTVLFDWRINSNWLLYELLIFYVGLTDFFFSLPSFLAILHVFHCDNLKDVKMFYWVVEGPYQSCVASLQVFHLSFFLSMLWL